MATFWQKKHTMATVTAGACGYCAQSNYVFALSKKTQTQGDAEIIADKMDDVFQKCQLSQYGAAAQACMSDMRGWI